MKTTNPTCRLTYFHFVHPQWSLFRGSCGARMSVCPQMSQITADSQEANE